MTPLKKVSAKKYAPRLRGVGDLIAIVAKPIARTVDSIFPTNLSTCSGCAARQETLNQILPFKEK